MADTRPAGGIVVKLKAGSGVRDTFVRSFVNLIYGFYAGL